MSKTKSFDDKIEIRNSLIARIRERISVDEMNTAKDIPNRSERIDAIANVLRDAVKRSSIVMFSGIPHVYVESAGCYQSFQWLDLNDALYDVMRKNGIKNGDYGKIDLITKRCMAAVSNRNCSVDMSVFVMANGVYNTLDHKMHPFSDAYMTNMNVGYAYNENDIPVLWKRFLNEVLPDLEMQRLLQEFLAATFVDRSIAKIEQCCILLGSGSNGKSVIFEVVRALLGEENVTNFSVSDLITSGKRDQSIAMCNGKRLNYCSEIRTHDISGSNADSFKSLVSGESTMARALYHDFFMAKNIPLLMANANSLPKLSDPSLSIQRRFLVIPFKSYISEEKQNKELASELKSELPAIFNWVMEGLVRLKVNKWQITVPAETRMIVADYIKDNNPIIRFCDERGYYPYKVEGVQFFPMFITIKDLFLDFSQWCGAEREVQITKNDFTHMMEDLKFQKSRRNIGSGFSILRAKSEDEIRSENLDAAIEMQKRKGIEPYVTGDKSPCECSVVDAERILGLPEGTIVSSVYKGVLEGAYIRNDDGYTVDIPKVVECLAASGYFKKMNDDENGFIRDISMSKRFMRKTFNALMKSKGLPIRKCADSLVVKKEDMYCVIVPDNWEYTERAVKKLFKSAENQHILAMWNEQHPRKQVNII